MKLNQNYSFFLLLIMPVLQPSFGQVPLQQIVKEAEKIFDTEITIERKELAAGNSGVGQTVAPGKQEIPSQEKISLQQESPLQPEIASLQEIPLESEIASLQEIPLESEIASQQESPLQQEILLESEIASLSALPLQPTDELFVLYAEGDGDLLGYCFASSAKGRFEYFEYFIQYDTSRVVQKVKVWKYRSSYGGAVAGKRWLRQFEGYRKGTLTYGREVQAISGATISGNALVSEVVRAGKVMEGLVR